MPLLSQSGDHLLLACGRHLLLSSIENSQPIHEFQSPNEDGKIVSFLTSSSSSSLQYLIACYSNKLTFCWNIQTRELIGSNNTAKKPTAITTAALPTDQSKIKEGEEVLLVSDKGGEVWAMPIPSLSKRVRLFGHTGSVITDTLVTKTASSSSSNSPPHLSIFTADRDEKIRITEFPATYVVQSYLLGHTDVITTMALSRHNRLSSEGYVLSAGWDHKLCVWTKKDLKLIDMTQVNRLENSTDAVPALVSEVAPAEEMTADAATEATAFEGDIQAGEANENDDENRPFDASKAGTFPMKIISSPIAFHTHNSSHTLTPIAIICWNLSEIKLYALEEQEKEEGKGHLYRSLNSSAETAIQQPQASHSVIPLPAPPVDCLWIQSDDSSQNHEQKLIVLLPAPHCVQIYSVRFPSLPMETQEPFLFQQLDLEHYPGLRDLNDYIRVNVSEYSQSIPFIDMEASEYGSEGGIRKHALDKPFDKGKSLEKKIQAAKRRKTESKSQRHSDQQQRQEVEQDEEEAPC